MKNPTIKGWNINLSAFYDTKSLTELKKRTDVFDNLPSAEKESAFAELWNKYLKPAQVPAADVPEKE